MPRESIRTFIALELNAKIKEKIVAIQNTLRQAHALKASWVACNNLHLTLKFLGDTPKNRIPSITNALKECCNTIGAIDCTITKAGIFPNDRFPRVVWVGIEKGSNYVATIAKEIENALGALGFKKEKREFKSHITIARIKRILDYRQFKTTLEQVNETFSPIEFLADKITLFESTLTSSGPVYSELTQSILR